MKSKSFRQFVEEKESEASSPYVDFLGDELGVSPEDLGKDPQLASFFSLGGKIKNLGMYRVVKFIKGDDGRATHAVIQTMEDRSVRGRTYKDEDGEMKRVSGSNQESRFVVPIEDLDGLLSQDFQPPPASGGMN